jgi:4-amino-4-deoxy-L-arabinose transferase-like glycosyltransferase
MIAGLTLDTGQEVFRAITRQDLTQGFNSMQKPIQYHILWFLAFVKLMLHFLTNGQYGYDGDELYYLAAGDRLAWGYTEFPPVVAIAAHISRSLMGDSLFAIRFFPAIAGALLVVLTGLMARELGGGRFAQYLAALSVVIAPYFLVIHTILTVNSFEALIWTLCAYLILLSQNYHQPKLWLLIGVVIGFGLLNKFSIVFFAFSVIVGLWLTQRQVFSKKWIWLGGMIAIALVMPTLIWQVQHGLPFLEHQQAANLYSKKPFPEAIVALLVQSTLMMHPFAAPIWLAGLFFYLKAKNGKPYRLFGWIFVITYGLFVLIQGKSYYVGPLYPMLFAGGAVMIEHWIGRRRRFKPVISGVLVVSTVAIMIPMTLPVLPMETLLRFSSFYSQDYFLPQRANTVVAEQEAPWQFRAMLGWEETVAQVSKVYHQLPASQKARTAILSWDYANAGAIAFYGSRYDLPKGISGAHTFYFWGYQNYSGEQVISLGGDRTYLQQLFDQVEHVDTVTHANVIGIKSNIPIYLCQGIKAPFSQSWSDFKAYFGQPYAKER